MNASLREPVRQRAGNCCEYCRLPQTALPFAKFHFEHIVARQHGGADDPANLALACDRCNAFKGPNLTGIDPVSQQVVPIFNPREHRWVDHFRADSFQVEGITDVCRATVRLLNMNARRRIQLRELLQIQLDLQS